MQNILTQIFGYMGLEINPIISGGEALEILILLLTLIVGFIYTVTTIGLWRQARNQAELQISPFLNFDIDEHDCFYLKNFGNSPAFNVEIEKYTQVIIDIPGTPIVSSEFDIIPIIEPKEKKKLVSKNYFGDKETTFDFSIKLNPRYQKETNYILTIWYKNLIGNQYLTKLQTGMDGLIILTIRPASIREKLFNWFLKKINPLRINFIRWGYSKSNWLCRMIFKKS